MTAHPTLCPSKLTRMLNGVSAAAELAMTATATILRPTQAQDQVGGWIDTYASVGTSICSYAPTQVIPREVEGTVTVRAISMWRFQFPLGTDIRNTDRLVVDGRTFEVVNAGSGSLAASLRVIAMEIL